MFFFIKTRSIITQSVKDGSWRSCDINDDSSSREYVSKPAQNAMLLNLPKYYAAKAAQNAQ